MRLGESDADCLEIVLPFGRLAQVQPLPSHAQQDRSIGRRELRHPGELYGFGNAFGGGSHDDHGKGAPKHVS